MNMNNIGTIGKSYILHLYKILYLLLVLTFQSKNM